LGSSQLKILLRQNPARQVGREAATKPKPHDQQPHEINRVFDKNLEVAIPILEIRGKMAGASVATFSRDINVGPCLLECAVQRVESRLL
jgi:hypothetical protein